MPTSLPAPVDVPPVRRWSLRRTEAVVSSMAVATALWLGLTAPTVSPVTPSAAPPSAAVAAPAAP